MILVQSCWCCNPGNIMYPISLSFLIEISQVFEAAPRRRLKVSPNIEDVWTFRLSCLGCRRNRKAQFDELAEDVGG